MPDEEKNQTAPPAPAPSSDRVGLRVSLIPAEEMERNDPRKGFRLFLIVVIAFVVVVGGICGILGYSVYASSQTVADLKSKTDALAKQSNDLASSVKEARLAQIRLKALASLLAQHKTGLKLLTFLEDHTLQEVAYSSLSVSDNSTVNLAVTAASFEAYAAQIHEMRVQSEVKSLTASGVNPAYDDKNVLTSVAFTMTLVLDPSIFNEAPADQKP